MAGIQHDDAPELRRRGRRRRDSRDRELEPWSAFPTKCGGVRYMAGYIKGKELPQTSGISGRICFDVFFLDAARSCFLLMHFLVCFLFFYQGPHTGMIQKGRSYSNGWFGDNPILGNLWICRPAFCSTICEWWRVWDGNSLYISRMGWRV